MVGITGVGGGSLKTPLLFGIHPASAVGTDLLYAAVTKAGGSVVHGRARTIDWRIVGRLAAGGVPASTICLLVLSRLELMGGAVRGLITTALGIALYVTALAMIFCRLILAYYAH